MALFLPCLGVARCLFFTQLMGSPVVFRRCLSALLFNLLIAQTNNNKIKLRKVIYVIIAISTNILIFCNFSLGQFPSLSGIGAKVTMSASNTILPRYPVNCVRAESLKSSLCLETPGLTFEV